MKFPGRAGNMAAQAFIHGCHLLVHAAELPGIQAITAMIAQELKALRHAAVHAGKLPFCPCRFTGAHIQRGHGIALLFSPAADTHHPLIVDGHDDKQKMKQPVPFFRLGPAVTSFSHASRPLSFPEATHG